MSGSDGCRGGGSHLSLVVLVSEKLNLVSEKSRKKSQGILFICGAVNPDLASITRHLTTATGLKVKPLEIRI